MNILGLAGGFGHDASAALLVDGRLTSLVEEERLRRRKHARGDPPELAALACVRAAGLALGDIDIVATAWDARLDPSNDRMRDMDAKIASSALLAPLRRHARWIPCDHHQSHALAAYGFSRVSGTAAVLVMDGRGELCSTSVHLVGAEDAVAVASSPLAASLGTFYASATDYCGFGYGGQGKTMGLAPFGAATEPFGELTADDLRVSLSWSEADDAADPTGGHRRVYRAWVERLTNTFGPPRRPAPRVDPETLALMVDSAFEGRHADAAASVQACLERLVTRLVSTIRHRYPELPVVITGGVGLNCAVNGSLRQRFPDADLYFPPAPHDSGTSLGAAMLAARQAGEPVGGGWDAYLGLGWTDDDIHHVLDRVGLRAAGPDDMAGAASRLILDGRAIGWFQGRAEVGPRALGHRSILASPFDRDVKERLNSLVKGRETWRPFGPSVASRDMRRLYGVDSAPFMIEAHPLAESHHDRLSAVAHVDGTSRPQSVDPAEPTGRYAALLDRLAAETGLGVVLNTSFNMATEPVVYTPQDALRTFFGSRLDALVMGPYLLEKPR